MPVSTRDRVSGPHGLSKKEIIRCLKRYVARDVYRRLVSVDNQ
jgi:hypothetical protein